MNDYQTLIHQSRYARWVETEGRRETWEETVKRYFDFIEKHCRENLNYILVERAELEEAVLKQDILPSMRALWTAGEAAERDNLCTYNCSFAAVDSLRVFDEVFYVLLQGVGAGYSVEQKHVAKLPIVNEHFEYSDTVITVQDTKAGWAKGLRELISLLYSGQIPKWDLSRVREAGAKCIVSGGRASGPEPLAKLFKFTVSLIKRSAGRRLSSVECNDLLCMISEAVVSGASRKGALISLSDLNDHDMRDCKSGAFWNENSQRRLANNSAVYETKPSVLQFMTEWRALYKSQSGERGIFNREAAWDQMIRNNREPHENVGTNPCGEILLDSCQLCNLTNTVVRYWDTFNTFMAKIRLATILGTIQSSLTKFKYLRKIWSDNCEAERLLGVGLAGVYDNLPLFSQERLISLRVHAEEVNKEWAAKLGINPSKAITCTKPDGNTSQLCDSASGIHPRYSEYYIRTIRGDMKDPLTKMLIDQGLPWEVDQMKPESSVVFSFPQHSPSRSILREEVSAIDHLELWKIVRENYCHHNPSVTISVRENEWMDVQAWVYRNFDNICGVSFLPFNDDDHVYPQAPYQKCSKEEYEKAKAEMPVIDWSQLKSYEEEDTTVGSTTLACSAGGCEVNYL